MVAAYEIAVGLLLVLLCRWVWRLQGGSRLGLALVVGVLAAYFGPLAWRADWTRIGQIAPVMAVAALALLGYAWGLARIRAAIRRRDEGR